MMIYQSYRGWTYTIQSFGAEPISYWYIFNTEEQIVEHGHVESHDGSTDDIHDAIAKAKKAIEFYS